MEEILIRVKLDHDDPYDHDSVTLIHEQVDFEMLLRERGEPWGFVKLDARDGISKRTEKLLRDNGWVHLKTAEDRMERKVLEDEYFIMDPDGRGWSYDPKFDKIDPGNLEEHQIKRLASGAKIVQKVAPKSVLGPSEYKKLQTQRKKIAEATAKKKATQEKRKALKKQREVAKAKKLLEEAGEV